MTMQSRWTGAAHLEEIAEAMTEIDTKPNDGRFIGIEEIVSEVIDHLLTAMFPYHFGKARGRFVETEKRTWELMRAYDALNQALNLVCDCDEGAATRQRSFSILCLRSLRSSRRIFRQDMKETLLQRALMKS